MKVAITGHTSGIGKSLAELFPEYMGFSRTNGYDISKPEDQLRILTAAHDCDVFINNAYSGWSQIDLLNKFWTYWQDLDKVIVCIGSNAAEYNSTNLRPYNIHKRALQDTCLQMHHSLKKCRVICVNPGYVDTPRVAGINTSKINTDELSQYIHQLINMKGSFWVPSITIYPSTHGIIL